MRKESNLIGIPKPKGRGSEGDKRGRASGPREGRRPQLFENRSENPRVEASSPRCLALESLTLGEPVPGSTGARIRELS